jgi:hypothetical protein
LGIFILERDRNPNVKEKERKNFFVLLFGVYRQVLDLVPFFGNNQNQF